MMVAGLRTLWLGEAKTTTGQIDNVGEAAFILLDM